MITLWNYSINANINPKSAELWRPTLVPHRVWESTCFVKILLALQAKSIRFRRLDSIRTLSCTAPNIHQKVMFPESMHPLRHYAMYKLHRCRFQLQMMNVYKHFRNWTVSSIIVNVLFYILLWILFFFYYLFGDVNVSIAKIQWTILEIPNNKSANY